MRSKVLNSLIQKGQLTLIEHDGSEETYGEGLPSATIRLKNRFTLSKILRNPYLNLGETYMDSSWDLEGASLRDLLNLFRQNVDRQDPSTGVNALFSLLQNWNSLRSSSRNVKHHYNLDEELFGGFLDEDMHYSCAYFGEGVQSLEDAQQNKCKHLMQKLRLSPGDRVLDIGCGWGSLAMYLAEKADVRVTGITLSDAQVEVARRRSRERNLQDKVDFNLQDYRTHSGKYDAIVSVGMFEHVGRRNFRTYFKKVCEMLKDDGIAVIHTIGNYTHPQATNPWIARYIFPGGYIPSLSEVMRAIEIEGLVTSDIEVWRRHYARTLEQWNERFQRIRERIKQKYDERFCRMWEFYLSACQSAFEESDLVVYQIQLALKNDTVPLTRDYLYV